MYKTDLKYSDDKMEWCGMAMYWATWRSKSKNCVRETHWNVIIYWNKWMKNILLCLCSTYLQSAKYGSQTTIIRRQLKFLQQFLISISMNLNDIVAQIKAHKKPFTSMLRLKLKKEPWHTPTRPPHHHTQYYTPSCGSI